MADNKSMTGGQDRSRINVNEDYEVQYWKDKFNVSADRLREAVNAVGDRAEAVEEYLKGRNA